MPCPDIIKKKSTPSSTKKVFLMKPLSTRQGSVSPLGILNDESRSVIFAADSALASLPVIGVHPNDNTATVFLSFDDLRRVIEEHGNCVVLVDFSSSPPQM